ncbi:NERD domain-containing protein [Paraburkholderia sp. CNPSo 3274]|uniref:nuclease-related domain-containing protein n=1 Tax=Paraburkholderia sp. CNPSo 3274 TaxID=2940932 RepID=UPI0020B63E0D|nr:nuclease-related domain-containing protein [Paraburkholderia sp. CNPSo 3274]MCP3712268.1 NERD domain-containing protein [Paraburkholderia sp. CNPSo 3274]
MPGIFAVLAVGFVGWRLIRRVPRKRTPRFSDRSPATRAHARGEAGEATVRAELCRVLTTLCGDDYYLHDGAVLLRHAPGTAFPTAEIDHLAVTPFGLFVIETKNWSGLIEPGTTCDELVRVAINGERETRRSPLAQNRTKVAFLCAKLPKVWTIEGLGVFAAPDCTLHPDLPPTLIQSNELSHCLRLKRHKFRLSGQTPVNVSTAWKAIMLNASIDAKDLEEHYERVRVNPKVVFENAV